MGTGDFVGIAALIVSVISLAISVLSLWQGWRSNVRNQALIDRILESHRRESNRVDDFIKHLMNQQGRTP